MYVARVRVVTFLLSMPRCSLLQISWSRSLSYAAIKDKTGTQEQVLVAKFHPWLILFLCWRIYENEVMKAKKRQREKERA